MATDGQTDPVVGVTFQALTDITDQWAIAIGRFLVAFNACEYWTYQYARTFGSQALRDAIADQGLPPRIAIARALLIDLGLIEPMQARVDRAFDSLARLAKTRNLVAHNAPVLNVYRSTEGRLEMRFELQSARDPNKEVTQDHLATLAQEAWELDQELALLYGLVRQSENRKPFTRSQQPL